jgi:hypothetical protein
MLQVGATGTKKKQRAESKQRPLSENLKFNVSEHKDIRGISFS